MIVLLTLWTPTVKDVTVSAVRHLVTKLSINNYSIFSPYRVTLKESLKHPFFDRLAGHERHSEDLSRHILRLQI